MSTKPKFSNVHLLKKKAVLQDDFPPPLEVSEHSEYFVKLILDLFARGLCPAQIEDHFRVCHSTEVSRYTSMNILKTHASAIHRLNLALSRWVTPTLSVCEIDETFNKQQMSFLVVVDTFTGFIFLCSPLKERNYKSLVNALDPFRNLFASTKTVLTDGAPYFPAVIKEIAPHVHHQICLVHVLRGFLPFVNEFKQCIYPP